MNAKLFIPFFLVALAPALAADVITGRVVDAQGAGVANVDIDAKNLGGGGDPTLSGDFTDANGNFTTIIPAGTYLLTFLPPPPPASTSLVLEVDDVVVSGTTNLGTLALSPGVSLSGHVQNSTGSSVVGVNIDVIDQLSGENLVVPGDASDGLGNFSIAVPAHAIELRLDATTVIGSTLASLALDLAPSANTDLGTLTLQPGFILVGTVKRTNGTAVVGADIDVFDAATNAKLYTPNDNTSSLGTFSVVVPAGTFDVEVCPSVGDLLVGASVKNVVVSGPKSLGTITLLSGVVLSGVVSAFNGSVYANCDTDVFDSVTLVKLVTCHDNTDATGAYSIVVPLGNFRVEFNPPDFLLPLGNDVNTNVVVTGNTLLDGLLPSCPYPVNYGTGLAGLGGFVPHLASSGGVPRSDNKGFAFELEDGRGGAVAVIAFSLAPASLPLFGGTLLVDLLTPGISVLYVVALGGTPGVGGAGSASFPSPAPLSLLTGITAFGQFVVFDAGAIQGKAMSDGISLTICP